MADKNPFDDPSFNKNPNPFDDPDFGGPSGVVRRVVGDSAVSLGKGVIGAGEAAVGLADLASGGRAGKFLSTAFGYDPKASKEMLDEYYSPEQRAANAAVQKAEGFFPTIATAIQNPSTIAQSAVESAPLMLGGGAVARGVRAALTPAAERAAAAVAGRAAASRVSPVVAGAVGEGAVTAGSQAEQIRQETKNGLLTPEQAALAAASGFATGALTLGAGRAAQKLGISDIDIALAGGGLQGQGKGLVRRAAEGALSEGILEEMPQSAQEQIAQNLALGKPWSEGVANAAAMGALTGGLIGGGVNVLSGPDAQPAPQPGSAGGVPLLPAPGSPGAPASEIGPDAGQMDLIRQHAIQNAVDAAAAQDAAREAEAQRLRAFHGPLSTASGPAPESPAPPPPPAGPALLMAPGSPGAPASEIGPDAGQMDLVRQHAIQNAVDAAAAQDAAREAEAQRLRSFHGPLSTAAATAVESGVAATSAQARAEALQDKVAPTQRLALPAPVTEQEKGAQAAINEYAGSKSSVPLDQAQAQSFNAFSRGHELVVVPHPSGKGYTTVPSSMLNPRQMAAVESIQRPDQGQIPSPNTEMPGQWVAPDGGLPAARTYDENQSTQRAAWSAWRTAAGTPVPRQPPIKDEARATQVAERRTQETGREHVVVPHPMSSTGFAVAPAPATIDGEATAVQEATAAAAAPEQASATAAAPQPAADAIGDEDAAANRAILAAAQESATSHRNDLSHPTSAQAKAGNYKKARLPRDLVGGLPVTLENEAGSVRVGTDGDWARAQSAHYGYIRAEGNPKAKGNDGDDIDIAIGPRPATGKTFIIDQDDPLTGDFDEHKVYHGYRTAEEAEAAYRANYPEGWNGFRGITEVSVDELKRWRDNDDKSIPYAENPGAEIMPDLDSRYQGNIDHAAGADALPVDRSRGSRGTRLAMRILRAPTMEAQDKGLEELPSLAKEIVAAALADVRDLGMPEVAFDGLSAIGMHNTQGGGEGVYAWSPQAISLHRRLLEDVARGDEMAARTLRGVIAHETWHHLDNGDVYFSSARSPLLEIVQSNGLFMPAGEIAIEAWEQFENPGSPLQRYLNYPLGAAQNVRAGLTALQHAEILQNEVFAQLGRLFYTNPKLMRERLPKAHRLFQEIHRGIESASNIGEARAAVRAALLSQAAVSRGADRGSDRNAREGSGDGRADHGRDGVQHVLESRSVATEGDGANGRGQRDARVPASRPDGEPQGQAPLVGLPSYSPGPFSAAREAAAAYMREAGLPYDPPTDFVKVDPENAKRVADAYAAMPHDPKNIQVRRAYRAMIKETLAQWRAIEKTGLKVTFGTKENPYPYTIPQDVFTDVRENNHMWVYPTSDGFGSDASFDASDNPLLEDTGIVIGGHKLLANDVFRIVHDYFGHIKEGVGFRANGEENAWRIHSAMYSPEARKAMTSETRGQNSWLNWGPHGEKNRTAKTEDTVFADQKTGLMPDWVVNGEKPPELEARETDDNVKSATVGAVRGERTTGRAALSAEDRAKIENQGRELGMTSKEIAELLDRARNDVSRFPAKDGWAPIEIAGVERKPKTLSDGEVIYENAVKYKVIGYGFNAPPGAARAPARIDEKWARKVATRMTKEVTDLYARAAAGDVVAQNIVAHASWYRAMTVRLREEFGAAADFYADLLGATSPNTPVETNWRFAIDIIKQFSRGEWKREMQAFERWVASGKDVSKFSPNDKIRQMSGKLYGMNSGNAMLALANLWRNVQPGTAPKARNFALNLIGQSNMATIDVWAARLLRRMANSIVGSTGKYPRIPTVSEKGVTGNWSADVSRVTGEFGFGAHVMDLVSDDLAKKGIDLTPPDLQAVAWFVEKALWTEEGWTSAHGEGGSFETEADKARLTRFLAGWSIQKDSPPADAAVDLAARRLLAVTAGDDQVIAVRATPTVGMYDAESHERAFDTELTVSPGWNPWPFIGELTRIAKDADQDSFFVSRALGPDESVDNARPGMEVYFKTARDLESALTVIRELVSSGQQGFTLTVDPRDGRPAGAQAERFNGVRLQYIPEFEIRFGGPDAEALSSGDQSRVAAVMDAKREALSRIANQIYGLDGVAKVMTYEYDTLVVTREEYDDYSDAGLGVEFEGSRSPLRGGQPLRETLESAARRYASGRRQERSGDLPHGPSAWDRLAAEEEVGKPDALEVREGYDDADHWKKSDTLDAREPVAPQGRADTRAFKRWFGDSKVVDKNGAPLVAYHTTDAADLFTTFKRRMNDIGIHFGTKQQAEDRFNIKIEADPYGPSLRGVRHATIPVYLSIKNPLRLKDLGTWDAYAIADALKSHPRFNSDDVSEAIREAKSASGRLASLRNLIERAGFDGIVYRNVWESGGGDAARADIEDKYLALIEVVGLPKRGRGFSAAAQETPEYAAWQQAKEDDKRRRESNSEDSYIAFRPTQIKSAVGNNGNFDSSKPSILEARETNEPQPLWYSGLSAALDKAPWAKDGTAGAGQLRAWLAARTKDGLVKSEELKWSGLDEYLAAQPGKVSRDDIKAFLDQNGVRVEEVELGGRYINPSTGETAPRKDGEGATKFGSYQLPGGENYRELLLTLPEKKSAPVDSGKSAATMLFERDMMEKYGGDSFPAVYGKLTGSEIDKYEMLVREDRNSAKTESLLQDRRNNYKSPHFDQPNILAHVRFNERTSADGKRVLFIEEVQSDWAQRGRKEGFAVPAPKPEIRHVPTDAMPWHVYMGDRLMDVAPTRAAAESQAAGRRNEIDHGAHGGIPAAPFVGKTEAWVALALKRMIRYAADNGFDAVAFTTGEQQAARYDLSKQIESVEYRMRADGAMGHLTAFDKSGNRVLSQHNVKPADLPDYIGKEAADRLMQSQGPGIYQSNDKVYVLTGEQLKVGGEGMRSFYDKIVPNVANDLLKKLGGGRVAAVKFVDGIPGTVDRSGPFPSVNAAMQPGFSITPEMRENASKPQALFSAGLSLDAVTDGVRDRLATSRSFNLWDRTVGTQLHKALKNEHFKRVYDGVQSYLNDASQMMSRAADLAPDMLPRLDGFKDILKRGPSKADLAKVSSAIFDGTIADTVYTDAELAQRGLNAKQIGLYRQSRAAIDRSLADAVTSEAVKEARGLLPNAVLDQAKSASDPWVVVNALAAIAQKTPAQQQVYDHLRLRAAQMSDLQRDGYAPLQRFGQYTVHVTNQDGSSDLFTMHESEAEANAFARGVRATLRPGQSLTQGVMSKEAWRTFQGVSPDTLQIFAESLGSSESEVMQKYIKLAVNNRSVLKRMLQRKEIAGFQTDVQRTLAQFITSNARAASKNYHWGDILRAENDIPKESGDVKDEAIKMRSYVQDAREEAGALRGLLFVQFLGGSVASAVTNATQPIMMTFPWLSQHVGPAEAASQIAKAGKVAAGAAAEPGLREAMERATKEGVIAPHEVAGLYAESIRSLGSNLTVRRALKLWGSLFSLAEQFNRRITFVAAYRAAEQRALGDPYAFAERAIAESQGVYNKGNRPVWARGPVGATLMTFKQYSIAYVELLARLPKREKAIMLAVLVLASGLQGLPGADDLEDVIDTIAESLGYSFNSKRHLREWATRQLGDTFGPLLTHGASALPGVPLDVQARLGLGNLIPGTGVLKRSTPDKGRDVLEFFGPAGSQINSLKDAFAAAQDGDVGAIASAAAPLAIKNALKGLDMLQSGYYKDMKGRRVIDTEAYEAAIKGVGFQPARVAAQTRRIQDIQQDIDLARAVEGKIVERWARGMVEHDYAAVHAARAELLAWNQRNPGNPIRIMPAQVRNRAKMMLMGREDRFLKSVAPEMRGKIRAELAA